MHIWSGKIYDVQKQVISYEFIGDVVDIAPKDTEASGIHVGDINRAFDDIRARKNIKTILVP